MPQICSIVAVFFSVIWFSFSPSDERSSDINGTANKFSRLQLWLLLNCQTYPTKIITLAVLFLQQKCMREMFSTAWTLGDA